MKKALLVILLIIAVPVLWYLISPVFNVIELHEASPMISETENTQVIAEATFQPSAHEVEGKAILIEMGDKKVLRFEDFKTINGPNLHVYLSSSLDETDYVDLGEIKGTVGNINYDIDPRIDTDRYNKVLIWCVPFKLLFSYAEL